MNTEIRKYIGQKLLSLSFEALPNGKFKESLAELILENLKNL